MDGSLSLPDSVWEWLSNYLHMRISPKYKVRRVADENVVLIQGKTPGDMTKVIALNETSLYLWDNLVGRDFVLDDVKSLLTDRFEVDEVTATRDAQNWISELQEHSVIV